VATIASRLVVIGATFAVCGAATVVVGESRAGLLATFAGLAVALAGLLPSRATRREQHAEVGVASPVFDQDACLLQKLRHSARDAWTEELRDRELEDPKPAALRLRGDGTTAEAEPQASLAESFSRSPERTRLVLLGDSGAGKSALLLRTALQRPHRGGYGLCEEP
jgi:hypothetical protein